jgi:hypothetical protein
VHHHFNQVLLDFFFQVTTGQMLSFQMIFGVMYPAYVLFDFLYLVSFSVAGVSADSNNLALCFGLCFVLSDAQELKLAPT